MSTTIARLPTRPQPRFVEEPGLQSMTGPIADALAFVTRQAKIHPNVVKMHDAVDRWVLKANQLGGEAGVAWLAQCAAQIEDNLQNLANFVVGKPGAELKPGMSGVTVGDLDAAMARITRAVDALTGDASHD